jgi:hypothetical protein
MAATIDCGVNMATFMSGGIDGYRATTYGKLHPNTVDYIQRSGERFSQSLNTFGRELREKSDRLYKRYDESKIVRLVRAASRKIDNWYRPEGVSVLSEIAQMQHANAQMRRMIMANPVVRAAYLRQECTGYGEGYTDHEPGRIGNDHYDYRRATDSMWMEDNGRDVSTSWSEEIDEDDYNLTFEERADILQTWNNVEARFQKGMDDPTDPFNSSL